LGEKNLHSKFLSDFPGQKNWTKEGSDALLKLRGMNWQHWPTDRDSRPRIGHWTTQRN